MKELTLSQLIARRDQIHSEIAAIESMRRGSFSEWTYNKTLKDGTVKQRGPFYRITRKNENNKTVTTPVPKAEIDYYKHEVAKYQDFQALTDEYAEVCEQISILSHANETLDEAKKN